MVVRESSCLFISQKNGQNKCRCRWIFSSVTCKAVGFINMLTLVASVMSLGLISINRYIKICHPNFYKGSYSARNILLMTAGVYSASFLYVCD